MSPFLDSSDLVPIAVRPWLWCAGTSWASVLAIRWGLSWVVIGGLIYWWVNRRLSVVVAVVAVVAALASMQAEPPNVEAGAVDLEVELVTPVVDGKFGQWAVVDANEVKLLADLPPDTRGQLRDRLRVSGSVETGAGEARGFAYSGVVHVENAEWLAEASNPIYRAGNRLRESVLGHLEPYDRGRGLLAGFLVGELAYVDPIDQEAMRQAGLSHFTAVSGSNVALFVLVVVVLLGPLSIGPRRRAVVVLLSLPFFAVATQFEPSVIRASVTAGLVALARFWGFVAHPWQILATAVILLLAINPPLSEAVGFQLSVAATSGVMLGARMPASSRTQRSLSIAVGAQLAVAPLLLAHFGRLPIVTPVANVLAAPVVGAATTFGVLGMFGVPGAMSLGARLAEFVLDLAHSVSGWPNVGWWGLSGLVVLVGVLVRWPRIRAGVSLTVVTALVVWLWLPRVSAGPSIVVLDVGQGDAILLIGDDGHFGLIDGGPDQAILIDKLRTYGVTNLDLLVLSHVHADHATGLIDLPRWVAVSQAWTSVGPHVTPASNRLFESLEEWRVPVVTPSVGTRYRLGRLVLEVLGPKRRYASPNDQSIVISVEGPAGSALMSGDIERVAQSELALGHFDVLKVPHQGAATSDLEWLRTVRPEIALVSVGPNTFGHPSPEVIAVLVEVGADVRRTDELGDLVVPLG